MPDEIYYVLAKVKESGDPYSFISYKREKRSDPIDIGLLLHNVQDFRLNHENALEAKDYLEKRGYDVIISKHYPGIDGINLDQIMFQESIIEGRIQKILKRAK